MDLVTFDMSEFHLYGTAFYDFLKLRKRFFVNQLNWNVPHNSVVEMDQYDNPMAFYSIVKFEGAVVGGARALPTDANWGKTSYMMRDASMGDLPDIPSAAMPASVETPLVWECTRLVISDDLTSPTDRTLCLGLIVSGLVSVASDRGAIRLRSISPLSFKRVLRQLGYSAEQIGETFRGSDDGRNYAAFEMSTNKQPVETEYFKKSVAC